MGFIVLTLIVDNLQIASSVVQWIPINVMNLGPITLFDQPKLDEKCPILGSLTLCRFVLITGLVPLLFQIIASFCGCGVID